MRKDLIRSIPGRAVPQEHSCQPLRPLLTRSSSPRKGSSAPSLFVPAHKSAHSTNRIRPEAKPRCAKPTNANWSSPSPISNNVAGETFGALDRKSTRLNSSHGYISYAVFCLKKKTEHIDRFDHIHKPTQNHHSKNTRHHFVLLAEKRLIVLLQRTLVTRLVS